MTIEAGKYSEPVSETEDARVLGFKTHDHTHCVATSISEAETYCAEHGLRFTPVRRRVLEILLTEHRAMGAYPILSKLSEGGFGSQPPVVYRALEFLLKHGLVHKIERQNAYIACAHPGQDHVPAFMICRLCDMVAEAFSAPTGGVLGDAADAAGFQIERAVVEAEGICPACLDHASA